VKRCAVDTNVLIYAHLSSFTQHGRARQYLQDFLADPTSVLVVVPIILHELVHVITDARRFEHPVKMEEAIAIARLYLNRTNIECVDIGARAIGLTFELMEQYRLGRNRVADSLLVATLLQHGVDELITCNEVHFAVFDEITTIDLTRVAS